MPTNWRKNKQNVWYSHVGFPDDLMVKNPPANTGDMVSIPSWEDPLE